MSFRIVKQDFMFRNQWIIDTLFVSRYKDGGAPRRAYIAKKGERIEVFARSKNGLGVYVRYKDITNWWTYKTLDKFTDPE